MSLKIDRAELEIVIKNDTSRKRMRELEDDMRGIRREMKKLDENSPEFKAKLADLKKAQAEYDTLVDKIGLAGLSMKELRKRQQELNAIIGQLPGNSPLYDQYKKQLDQVNARMKELRGTAGDTQGSLSKLADGFNKYFNLGIAFAASITGVSMAFRKLAEDVAHMDDVYSDVMKTTGMTREEVLALNEELKKMDTRTSRESLNNLARDAGKLGIEGTKNILDFVDAGNQINVALGEDLGEDAIKNIGKMVGVFQNSTKQLQGIGLKEQMLAVGSAVNELGASSTASEPYLVSFAGRLGGISKQANISMADILGFASALDQDMQQVEMSATALQNFIMKLMGEPAKFAKLAGLEVSKFTQLLNTDTNAAIKQVLRALNEQGGFQALIPIFQEMGLDGARATGVLSAMAGSIDKIDEAQRVANGAMTEGNSITKEYSIKNNNLAAELDKARKKFQETALQLGESLNPILLKSTKATTYLIKALVELPIWLKENKGLLITLTSVMTAYAIAVNRARIANLSALAVEKLKIFWAKASTAATLLQVAVTGYLTGGIRAANLATKAFFATMGLNPFVAIGVAVAALTVGIYKLVTSQNKLSLAAKTQLEIQKKASEEYQEQSDKIAYLNTVIHSEILSQQERKKALEDLKSIIPGYNGMLNEEGKLINDNKKAIDDYLVSLEKQIKLKAAKDEWEALIKLRRQQQKELDEATKLRDKSTPTYSRGGMTSIYMAGSGTNEWDIYDKLDLKVRTVNSNIAETNTAIQLLETEIKSSDITPPPVTYKVGDEQIINGVLMRWDGKKWVKYRTTPTPDPSGDTKADPYKKELEEKQAAFDKGILLQKESFAQNKISEDEFQKNMLQSKKDFLNEKLQLEIKYGKDTTETLTQLADMQIEENKRAQNEVNEQDKQAAKEREEFEKQVADIIERYGSSEEEKLKARKEMELSIIKKAYDQGIIDAEQYAAIMKRIMESAAPDPENWTEKAGKIADGVKDIAGNASGAMQGFQAAEERAIETKYQKQIDAAKKAGRDTTEIEERKNKELAELRAKNADANFVVTAASIIAQTASAAINSFNNASVWGGPIAGGIAAAAAIAFGSAQLAEANAAREAAKEGYFYGGFTNTGLDTEEAGKVHKNEFVANAKAVRNPHVRKFLDVFNQAQMNGTIQMINTTQILERVRYESTPGYAAGGYVQTNTKATAPANEYLMAVIAQNNAVMAKLNAQLEQGIEAYSVISGKTGSYEKTKQYERYINNASR